MTDDDDNKAKRCSTVFRVYPFPDLRTLRKLYPDTAEEDFGLTRSTTDAALRFFRLSITCEDEDASDDLAEFLDGR